MADAKITELTELATASSDDLLAVVDAPGTSPVTKKIVFSNLLGSIPSSIISDTDSTDDLGSSSKYWANAYIDSVISPLGRGYTVTVASSTSSNAFKAQADYVCDGTADNVQIQAALDALPAFGGSVKLSEGTFYIAAKMTFPAKPFTLEGAGMGATYLRLVNGVNDNMFEYTTATDITFIKVGNMTLYGNASNQTVGIGIYINPGAGANHIWDARFEDLFILTFYTQGFYTNDAHGYVFDHVIVEYCGQAAAETTPAINFAGGDLNYISNCLIKLNYGRGMTVSAYGTAITGCTFSQNGETGLLLAADDCHVANNSFDNNGLKTSNTFVSLRILNDRSIINGNAFWGSDSHPSHCIGIDSGGDNSVITNNTFAGFSTAAISDAAIGTRYRSNSGWADSGFTFLENASIELDAVLSADEKYCGITELGTMGYSATVGDLVYLAVADTKWEKAKADVAATSFGKIGLVTATTAENATCQVLLYGKMRSAAFPTLTVGAPVYISAATAGLVTTTAPSGTTGFVVRIVGHANTAEDLLFNPDQSYLELA